MRRPPGAPDQIKRQALKVQPMKFCPAPEAADLAKEVIERHHPHLLEHAVRIDWLFSSKALIRNGKSEMAVVRKMGALTAYYAGSFKYPEETGNTASEEPTDESNDTEPTEEKATEQEESEPVQPSPVEPKFSEPGELQPFFTVIIAKPVWDKLPCSKKLPLLDHCLCFMAAEEEEDGSSKLSMKSEDVKEFTPVLERWGPWTADIDRFIKANPQQNLFAETEEAE